MNTEIITSAAIDLATILALCAMYVTRHRRRDLVVSYLVINVGIFTVTTALAYADATSAGFGMGLFGVLSIIRLRSTQLDQREVAYYFCSLAFGLLAGIGLDIELSVGLMVLLLAVMFIADSAGVLSGLRSQSVTVDRAISDEQDLKNYLARRFGYEIESATITSIDLINERTIAEIHYNADKKLAHRASVSL